MNVALRPLSGSDLPWLETWLEGVAASVGYGAAGLISGSAGRAVAKSAHPRVIERGDRAVGLLVYRLRVPDKESAIIDFVGTPREEARRGAGLAAASRVEHELAPAGCRRIYAPAPAMHGIDVYFWIRLGYRPLLRDWWPCEREGIAWFRRDLGAG